jgi:hypothetical protein
LLWSRAGVGCQNPGRPHWPALRTGTADGRLGPCPSEDAVSSHGGRRCRYRGWPSPARIRECCDPGGVRHTVFRPRRTCWSRPGSSLCTPQDERPDQFPPPELGGETLRRQRRATDMPRTTRIRFPHPTRGSASSRDTLGGRSARSVRRTRSLSVHELVCGSPGCPPSALAIGRGHHPNSQVSDVTEFPAPTGSE